jgi:uncharacterized protein (TIGR03118 family)
MMKATNRHKFFRQAAVLVAALISLCASSLAQDSAMQYTVTNLVSNTAAFSPVATDPNLQNGWGMARASVGYWWVADNASGLATTYGVTSTGTAVSIGSTVVTIPPGNPTISPKGSPSGIVYNGNSHDFLLAPSAPAEFLFCTWDGTISGFNSNVNRTNAVIKVNQTGNSMFAGMAVAQVEGGGASTAYLYVADFKQGRIEIFDTSFNPVTLPWGRFQAAFDRGGYSPINIWNIGGNLYVAYTLVDENYNSVAGPGLGRVLVFSPSGRLLQQLQPGPWFNAPWGLAMAPSDFGLFSHDILVGQLGSGEILAFDPVAGKFRGKLLDSSNKPITIDGLSALSFGNNGSAGPATGLFFTAGPNDYTDGLFGVIFPVPADNIEGNDR